KPRSAVGSATCAPFTRSTTSPLRSPSFANRLSSRIWKRRKPAGRPSRTSATARSCVMRPLTLSTAPATSRRSTMKAFSAVRRVRGDRGGGFGRRWRHVVDGRVETGGDPDPGQVRDEREESELEDEPVTPDEPHDGSAGSYAR